MESGHPRNERVVYEDQRKRAWERDPEDSGNLDGDAPTVSQEERGDTGDADLEEEGESVGVMDEGTISPVPEKEEANSPEPNGDAPAGAEAGRGESVGEALGEEAAEQAAEETATVVSAAAAEVTEKKTPEEESQLPTVSEKKRGFWRRMFGG